MSAENPGPNGQEIQFPTLPNFRGTAPPRLTCFECGYFVAGSSAQLQQGACHGNPPMAILVNTKDGPAPAAIRPTVTINDIACRHFKDRKTA